MFNPNDLVYMGKQQHMDVFFYEGVRIQAVIAGGQDGRYLYLSLGRELPEAVLPGLLAWFGIDRRQAFAEYEFPDRSCYFVQKRAA